MITQILSGEKIVPSRFLNVLGMQVARISAAEVLSRFRRAPQRNVGDSAAALQLQDLGYYVIEEFLPVKQFETLKRQLFSEYDVEAPGFHRHMIAEGDPLFEVSSLLYDDDRITSLFRSLVPDFGRITNRYVDTLGGEFEDAQAEMHRDTWQPSSYKLWCYLESVEDGCAPFVYVPESHKLEFRRLIWEYQQSISYQPGEDASFRFKEGGILDLRGRCETFIVPANTVIIADTRGFHCREPLARGKRRIALGGTIRLNPFASLLGGKRPTRPGVGT